MKPTMSNKLSKKLSKKLSIVAICLLSSGAAFAEKLAITGATIHTVAKQGTVQKGTVLIEDGKIKQVLDSISIPSGYTEIDARGKVLTPGFIGALTNIGLVEVGSSAGVVDARVQAHPISTVGAAYDVQYAINPDSTVIDVTRLEGFTSAVTGISGTEQLFNGQGAVISLDKTLQPLRKVQAFTHIDVSNGGARHEGDSRAAMWVALNQSLAEAEFAQTQNMQVTQAWEGMITRADAKALGRVLEGEMPLLITANRAADILQVIALKKRFDNINVVLVEASDGWRVAKQIAAANIPVILDPEYNLPSGFDHLAATLENAARLHKAGVLVAIGVNTHNIRLAPQNAGNAVANGLPHSAGIAALTINPAQIFGVDDSIGSIEVGKDADLVIWSGDPLEVTQAAEQVFISGKSMPMVSRQTLLRDRYLK